MDQNPPKESRPPINLRIKFRSESVEQFIERYAVDVSRGGIFIRTREPLAVGTQLKLDFQFQNGSALMAGDGTVVWIREFDANRTNVPPGMGVRFDKLTPESQAVLEQLLLEKAKRERSGIPGSQTQGAGGIAVRRSSSTFSTLDGQGSGPVAGASPSSPIPAAAEGEPTSASPLSPLATVAAEVASSLRAGAGSAPSTASGAASSEAAKKPETAAYRPLGTARNPFSSVAPVETTTSSAITVATKRADAGTAGSDDSDDSAAPFDDINDEPTQIAGRLPSFLLSDDDATVANAQMPGRSDTDGDQNRDKDGAGKKGAGHPGDKNLSTESAKDSAARAPLPGMGRKSKTASAKTGSGDDPASKNKATATATAAEVPPVSSPAASPSTKEVSKETAGASADTADAAGKAANPSSVTPSTTTKSTGGGEKRRSGAALVAATVVVLGGATIFLVRFFTSQATQTGPSAASTVSGGTMAAAGPPAGTPTEAQPPAVVPPQVPGAGSGPPPTTDEANSAPSGPSTEPAVGQPQVAALEPTPGASDRGAATEAPEGSSRKPAKRRNVRSGKDSEGVASVAGSGEAKAPEGAAAPASPTAPSGTTAAAGSASAGSAPAPTGTAATKAEDRPSTAAGDGDGPTHQIRVTSKPEGADVTLDGQTVGKTPFAVGIADVSAPHFIAVHKDGFEPFEQMISATSAWSKPKPLSKGKLALQVLKITAKLKPVAGAEVRPSTQPEPASGDSPNKAAPAPKGPAALKPAAGDSPLAPTEDRSAAESKP